MTDIVLTQPHTHAGVAYHAGDRIAVDMSSAQWLIACGVATAAEPAADKPTQRGKALRVVPSAETPQSPDQE